MPISIDLVPSLSYPQITYCRHAMIRNSLLILGLLLTGCTGNTPPPEVLPQDKFAAVYIDLLEQSVRVDSTQSDSVLSSKAASILTRHGTTREQFRATYRWYNENPQQWESFFGLVGRLIEERRKARQDSVLGRG
jgi:hypothetical protein